jgi:hypothetical protein
MVVSGIAKPPPHSPPRPVQKCVFKQEKGGKSQEWGEGVQSDIFLQIFEFLIYYI